MAEICLVYLLNISDSGLPLDGNLESKYPLARMSAEIWIRFYFKAIGEAIGDTSQDLKRVHRLISRLLKSLIAYVTPKLLSSRVFSFYYRLENPRPKIDFLRDGSVKLQTREEYPLVGIGQNVKETTKRVEKRDVRDGFQDLKEEGRFYARLGDLSVFLGLSPRLLDILIEREVDTKLYLWIDFFRAS